MDSRGERAEEKKKLATARSIIINASAGKNLHAAGKIKGASRDPRGKKGTLITTL